MNQPFNIAASRKSKRKRCNPFEIENVGQQFYDQLDTSSASFGVRMTDDQDGLLLNAYDTSELEHHFDDASNNEINKMTYQLNHG
jgi:hypothetical protein